MAKARKKRRKAVARRGAKRKPTGRKSRRKTRTLGIVGKLARAAEVVGESMQEASELRRKMGSRGGLSEG